MLADKIREFVFKTYVEPAKRRGDRLVEIHAGDVHEKMGLTGRVPAVCGAIGTLKFQRIYMVRLVNRDGPTQASNVVFIFEVL